MHASQEFFHYEAIIGSGGFGTVHRARTRRGLEYVAIKVIDQDHLNDETNRRRLMREIEILRQLDHPFIAKIFSVFAQAEGIAIVQEYASRRTLFDQITNHGPVSETQAKYYFMQLIAVLEYYLHFERKVTHRDFKLENILLDAYDNIEVVDFGLSRTFSDDHQRFTTPCGSPPYLAPELLSTGIDTLASDIWSLGIVSYSTVIGSMPFFHDDFQTLCGQILSKKIHYPMFLPDDLIDLLKKMLCRQPPDRITIQRITNHPWFPHKQYHRSGCDRFTNEC
jgi:serine/threonine protein kinase